MTLYTFDGIRRHRRCPYEYRMDSRAPGWRITADECMDMAVRDAVLASETRRVMRGERISRDDALSFFWESWDRHYPDVDPLPEDAHGLIRYGERCMDRYLSACGRYDVRDVIKKVVDNGDFCEVQELYAKVSDPEQLAQLKHYLELSVKMAPITPDHHFYIDQGVYSRMRVAFIQIGKAMVRAGILEDPEDIFMLKAHPVAQRQQQTGQSLPPHKDHIQHDKRAHVQKRRKHQGRN